MLCYSLQITSTDIDRERPKLPIRNWLLPLPTKLQSFTVIFIYDPLPNTFTWIILKFIMANNRIKIIISSTTIPENYNT